MQPIITSCQERNCKHFGGVMPISDDGMDFIFFCDAFKIETGGIPDKIIKGKDLHFTPVKGQKNNIVFEKE